MGHLVEKWRNNSSLPQRPGLTVDLKYPPAVFPDFKSGQIGPSNIMAHRVIWDVTHSLGTQRGPRKTYWAKHKWPNTSVCSGPVVDRHFNQSRKKKKNPNGTTGWTLASAMKAIP